MRKLFFLFLLTGLHFAVNTYAVEPLKLYEDSIRQLGKSILSRQSLSERKPANEKMLQLLYKILQSREAWDYPFDSLGAVGVLVPGDKAFRIFNWEFPLRDGTYQYFAFVQFPPQQGLCRVVELLDSRASIKSPERAKLKADNWLGAHYYQIFYKVHRKKKTYFLLGLDWNNRISRKKIIEPMSISPAGDISFGAGLFNVIGAGYQRVIFEYSAEISMSLRYNEKKDLIIFDHLVPKSPELKGQYQFYAPDLSYDALRFRKGRWQLKENIDARNEVSDLDDKPALQKKLQQREKP